VHEHKYSSAYRMLMADCHAEICIPVVALGLWWKERSGANTTSVRHSVLVSYRPICIIVVQLLSFIHVFLLFLSLLLS